MNDRPTDRAVVLTTWESEVDMKAAEAGNYPTQIAKVAALLAGPPARETYEGYETNL